MPYQVRIDQTDCHRAAGQDGLAGMIAGLRMMKAWADEHAPGWRYVNGRQTFQFATLEQLDRFTETFVAPEDHTGVL